ncbi:helix-turn-helix transcriptional regulator [Termitidicoccus mucosus]|uniref:HTH araC/xylS-type domain-containing protein n=1 Tax=Termitidicoccus mucosus TaxID=1184151 RepID=A0A178IN23_9BACT|nr:hypothetical protein AW736_07780 [Opitutaceae bacterium TSB47]
MTGAPDNEQLAGMPSGSMRLIDWTSLQCHLTWVYEGPVFDCARTSRETTNDVSCWLMRRGRVELTTGGNRVTARKGEWAFVAAPTRTQKFSADAEILSVRFQLAWPSGDPLFARTQNQVFPAAQFPGLEKTAMRLLRLVRRHMPKVDANVQFEKCSLDVFLSVQNLLPAWQRAYVETMLALGHMPHRLTGVDERALQLVRTLDHHPLEESFAFVRFARDVGLTPQYLAGIFLRSYGMTPKRYLEHRRLEAARHALAHTSISVKAAAYSLGFRHESHFCAWFKQHEGRTPSDFRTTQGNGR